jgi:hypothetical protein
MRPIYLTNTVAGAMKAPSAKDIHGRQLEFAPSGSTAVDERAFHDAWVRAMLGRGVLLLDYKLSSLKIGGILSPRELGIEFANRLLDAGFDRRDITAWMGEDPAAGAPCPVEGHEEANAEAARLELEAASRDAAEQARKAAEEAEILAAALLTTERLAAEEQARKDAEEAAVLEAARLETERRDAEALAALEAEEAAAKAAAISAAEPSTPEANLEVSVDAPADAPPAPVIDAAEAEAAVITPVTAPSTPSTTRKRR